MNQIMTSLGLARIVIIKILCSIFKVFYRPFYDTFLQ